MRFAQTRRTGQSRCHTALNAVLGNFPAESRLKTGSFTWGVPNAAQVEPLGGSYVLNKSLCVPVRSNRNES